MTRAEYKKFALENNKLGERIKWLREKFLVGFMQIEKELGIPESTVRDIENGGRTLVYEDLLTLMNYFNTKLDNKYLNTKPLYKGKKVEKITISWILFGYDPEQENYHKHIERLTENFRIREMELIERNFDLDRIISELRQDVKGAR